MSKCKTEDNWFKCNDGLCVTGHWRCDGNADCMDRSDEFNCVYPNGTKTGNDGRIVTDSGLEDAKTGSINEFLWKPCDNATEFQCKTSTLCVPKYWLCDGMVKYSINCKYPSFFLSSARKFSNFTILKTVSFNQKVFLYPPFRVI